MRFTLLETDGSLLFLIYITGAVISWAIFYYTIKAAVKNGVLEANAPKPALTNTNHEKPIDLNNVNDIDVVHHLYNSAQISLADYQAKLIELRNKNKSN
jgi:hypothetical protein